jgi:hypothetical protein
VCSGELEKEQKAPFHVTPYLQPWCWTEGSKSKRRPDLVIRICFWADYRLWGGDLQSLTLFPILQTKSQGLPLPPDHFETWLMRTGLNNCAWKYTPF